MCLAKKYLITPCFVGSLFNTYFLEKKKRVKNTFSSHLSKTCAGSLPV